MTDVTETVTAPKAAAKKAVAKKRKPAPKKKTVKKKTAKKRNPKTAAKKAVPKKTANGKKIGRPLQFEDATVVRMPKGWLKIINSKAKAKDMGQGEYVRAAIGRAIGQKTA